MSAVGHSPQQTMSSAKSKNVTNRTDNVLTPKELFQAKSVFPQRHTRIRALNLSSLKRIYEYVVNYDQNKSSPSELEIRLQTCEDISKKFNAVQEVILETAQTEETVEDVQNHAEVFETMLYSTKSKIRDILSRTKRTVFEPPSAPPSILNQASFKLPAIQLPVFDGDVLQWLPFSDSFTSMIHENQGLADIQKLHYLKSSLKGPALEIIQTLETTSGNYPIAWELLKNRYHNPRILMEKYVRGLFSFPTLARESAKDLRKMHTDINKHVAVIDQLGIPTAAWDKVIVIISSQKLDPLTYKEWENDTKPTELPSLKLFNEFLERRCQVLEAREANRSCQIVSVPAAKPLPRPTLRPAFAHPGLNQATCLLQCANSHPLFMCPKFIEQHPAERLATLRYFNLCFNCMRSNHTSNVCQARSCQKCGAKHNTMLHNEQQFDQEAVTVNSCNVSEPTSQVLLATAVVLIADRNGSWTPCRALLDSGSQTNFISRNMYRNLRLKPQNKQLLVRGIGSASCQTTSICQTVIRSRFNTYSTSLEFAVIGDITGRIPSCKYDPSNLNLPAHIKFADPNYNVPGKIDLLIGAELFLELLIGEPIKHPGCPALQNTEFGYVVSGKINSSKTYVSTSFCHLQTDGDCYDDERIQMLWRLDNDTPAIPRTTEDLQCETHFVDHTFRRPDGRFVVRLPLKEDAAVLGDSKDNARRMFHKLESKLMKDVPLRNMYIDFMREYEALGHMIESSPEPEVSIPSYFIPHHAVVNLAKSTTKLRTVFNASAKTTSGKSLNDILMVGQNVQSDIQSILLRFRMHKFVFAADVQKMFRQIRVDNDSSNLQQIFWRESPNVELKCYKLVTVTYGTASASFLATRCLKELAEQDGEQYPSARDVLLKDVYVDDVLTGADSLEALIKVGFELDALLRQGGFELHKWSSNSADLLSNIPETTLESPSAIQTIKTLGVHWNPEKDALLYNINVDKYCNAAVTKRSILQCIASIYDPLGLIAPVITASKLLLQQVWIAGLDWDSNVPIEITNKWVALVSELRYLNYLEVPRRVICNSPFNIQLHGFCDASQIAYGAVLYIRCEDNDGNVNIEMIYARSRLAPAEKKGKESTRRTLPELELCGAALFAEMTEKTLTVLNFNVHNVLLWTDSLITLARICSTENRWSLFVSNRVNKIQRTATVASWRHVRGIENPADVVSRGCTPGRLISDKIWWNGPSWLELPYVQWPSQCEMAQYATKMRQQSSLVALTSEPSDLFGRYSDLYRLIRVVSWCLRFINAARKTPADRKPFLTVREIDASLTRLIGLCQTEAFGMEKKCLRSGKQVQVGSRLTSLSPMLREDLIVVGGRLQNSSLDTFQKHPIILPQHHDLTRLIVRNEHLNGHLPEKALLYAVRRKYWPLCGQRVVHNIVHNCIPCFRAKPRGVEQLMGSMPSVRVTPSRAFLNTGVDFCGPIKLKSSMQRKYNVTKAWICVFVCMSVKAVHLEIVTSLSTEAFLMALDRFHSRRGHSEHMYCDNGTNFRGASNEQRDIYVMLEKGSDAIHRHLAEHRIQWHFIPPRAPNFGGLWESCVKQVKMYIKRTMGDALYNYEGYSTVLGKIEACLNSRPLTPISNDPNDLLPLTPAHFLIGESLVSSAEADYTHLKRNRLSLYQDIKRQQQVFWKRFSLEYLNTLQQRMKNHRLSPNLAVGQLVLLKEDNLPPLKWALGRILSVHPGTDGLVRVVEVRTSGGQLTRSVGKICPLPTEQQLMELEGD